MYIVTRAQLCKMPNGTVFMLYDEDITDGEIHIITGHYKNNTGWNGELSLVPFWERTNDIEKYCQWSTADDATCDYDEKQKFIVYSKTEVQQMINALIFALSGCETNFNEDIWICGDTILTDSEFYEDEIQY